jgi:hypothetical protein
MPPLSYLLLLLALIDKRHINLIKRYIILIDRRYIIYIDRRHIIYIDRRYIRDKILSKRYSLPTSYLFRLDLIYIKLIN